MNRKISICLWVCFCMSLLLGCSSSKVNSYEKTTEKSAQSEKATALKVVSTIFPSYDFARQIAGDLADVVMLLPPGVESHSYEPTPKDTITIQNCDIFIYTGGEGEAWVAQILEAMDTSNMQILSMLDCVEPVIEEQVEGMQAEPHDHDAHEEPEQATDQSQDANHEHPPEEELPEYDEHVWTDPQNAMAIVRQLTDALCQADAENAETYQASAAQYLGQLETLHRAFEDAVNAGTRKTLIVGDRFPFRYLTEAYGLTYYAAFPGCSTETEPSAQTVSFLIDKVKQEHIPVVFHVELSNEKMADILCEETGAEKRLLHACHNISRAEFQAGITYLELMQANVENLKEALK